MSHSPLPVVAAVPNYNMAGSLQELLPNLLEQGYSDVFVLDDASTDNSIEVAHSFGRDITTVTGTENIGAGANRNRIIPALGYHALIHFIDADMELETVGAAEVAQGLLDSPTLGFVGGLVKQSDGVQHPFNYGPRFSLRNDLKAQLQVGIDAARSSHPAHAAWLRQRFGHVLRDWPNQFEAPVARKVFWTTENMVIDSQVFASIGGYDPSLREREVMDLAIRLDKSGLEQRFDPALSGVHKAAQVRDYNRLAVMMKADFYIARTHGLSKWLLSSGDR